MTETEASYDTTAPTIGSAKLSTESIYAPDVLQIELTNIVEDGSGIKHMTFVLISEAGHEIRLVKNTHDTPIFTSSKYVIDFNISSSVYSESYHIGKIFLYDIDGNYRPYSFCEKNGDNSYKLGVKGKLMGGEEYWLKDICISLGSVQIYSETFDATTSVANPNVASLISKMNDGGTMNLLTTATNTTVPKAAFDAIKGTNKNIDCKVDLSTVQDESYGTANRLMRTTFASNGKLPGKAKIKLKSDYLSKLYNVGDKLNVYYLEDQKLTLEGTASTMNSRTDAWCEYEVTHNSTFLLSKNKLAVP